MPSGSASGTARRGAASGRSRRATPSPRPNGSRTFIPTDILVVGGTVEGVEKALELRRPTDFIPERVLVLTPFPYLGEDVAGTYELGFGESAPTGGLRAAHAKAVLARVRQK